MVGPNLPDLSEDEELGRSVLSSRVAKRARTHNQIMRDVFLEKLESVSLSIDRLGHAPAQEMAALATKRAEQRMPKKSFFGWAVITVGDAGSGERRVEATRTPENRFHADIFLNVPDTERRDHQKAHALELAAKSRWKPWPPVTASD